MKKKIVLPLVSLLSIGAIIYIISCKKNVSLSTDKFDSSKEYTLTQIGSLGEGIYLPIGTRWHYTTQSGNEVRFALPEGYAFLIKDLNDGTDYIDPGGDGYSCSCSGNSASGSCTVFYNEKSGYGCLQSSCTGSCTGTPTLQDKKIVGVINLDNDYLEHGKVFKKASLSEEGKEAFFSLPQVQAELKTNYDFVYENIPKPNFDQIDPKHLPSNYFIGRFSLYGFEFGILLPKDESLLKILPELRTDLVAPTCSCSGTPGGDNCAVHKKCLLGNCVFYCSGCEVCTMN